MNKIQFDNIVFSNDDNAWELWEKSGANGVVKSFISNNKRLRLLELPAGFNEKTECLNGHQGYVISGYFTIILGESEFRCKPGDFFSIPDGIPHRSRGDGTQKTKVFVVDDVILAGDK